MTRKKTDDACISDPSSPVVCSKGIQGCTVDHSEPVDQAVLDDINAQYNPQQEKPSMANTVHTNKRNMPVSTTRKDQSTKAATTKKTVPAVPGKPRGY